MNRHWIAAVEPETNSRMQLPTRCGELRNRYPCNGRAFFGWRGLLFAAVTRLKAFSKSFGSSEAPTCFAISTKRLWRSASVSFGFDADLRTIVVTSFFVRLTASKAAQHRKPIQRLQPLTQPKANTNDRVAATSGKLPYSLTILLKYYSATSGGSAIPSTQKTFQQRRQLDKSIPQQLDVLCSSEGGLA
jgi:hypothetical protein